MGIELKDAQKAQLVANIQYAGEKLILPVGTTIDQNIDLLKRRKEYETLDVSITETLDVFPWDGAIALTTVLERKYGWANGVPTPGFFGDKPPQMIAVDTGPHTKREVPWGRFTIPGIVGFVATGFAAIDERLAFQMTASVKRMYEDQVRSLFEEVRAYALSHSIYKGNALTIRFRDRDGNKLQIPEVKFIDTAGINVEGAIYADHVAQQIHTNIYTPILRAADCTANGIPLKRTAMLAGTYGTGKTLAAAVASRHCTDHGITFISVDRADELADGIRFARRYQSPLCVVFCEDIDRNVNGSRTLEMDEILNIIDGIDSKTTNILTVLTTNDIESINPAMLRWGRVDAVINVTPPDAKAVEKLIRLYAGTSLEVGEDLSVVGELLAGQIPAQIAEVVKRAKLSQLGMQPPGTKVTNLSSAALLDAAHNIKSHRDLMERLISKGEQRPPEFTVAMRELVSAAVKPELDRLTRQVSDIAAEVGA